MAAVRRARIALVLALLPLAGCGLPAPLVAAGLGACAAACGPVVNLEKDGFDWATGQAK